MHVISEDIVDRPCIDLTKGDFTHPRVAVIGMPLHSTYPVDLPFLSSSVMANLRVVHNRVPFATPGVVDWDGHAPI